ncbi:hypothetical protein PLANPX_4934 [Lacipirellula parvula]|uniref:Planctomycete extracellular domain-containing protein n=1 Tax=Lacipirellula parvula TaxID=2650471 RepID=A0A5K7XH04_9BACT|nr:hypothetical protein PLANPX_4934 [Lacipirellula parvula]
MSRSKSVRNRHSLVKSSVGRRLALESLESRQLLAADFNLLKDVNATPNAGSSFPHEFVQAGAKTFFSAHVVVRQRTLGDRRDGGWHLSRQGHHRRGGQHLRQ